MLSAQTQALIKATVPALEAVNEKLTSHFYKIMFSEYPQVRALFNQAHQQSGDQPRALANSVIAYAKHIDRLEALGSAVGLIVHKHASLNVLPEHYPIVGSCLLRAIREVLGAAATDEIVDAWAQAYQQLADILIQAEEQVYAEHEQANGGWRGVRPLKVTRKVKESDEITSFYLEATDGRPLLAPTPGQYLALRFVMDGQEMRRNYSLSDVTDGSHYRISVKREPGGVISTHLHDRVAVGDLLEAFPPCGDFVLNPGQKPLLLLSGGVGLTPTVAMLNAAVGSGRPIHFLHCARNRAVHAFREHVDGLAARHANLRRTYLYSQPAAADQADAVGLISESVLAGALPADRDAEVYFIGPKPFMAEVKRLLAKLGVPEPQTHYEFFGPLQTLE